MTDTTATVKKDVTIVNRRGLHARASAKFAKLAAQFDAEIVIQRGDLEVPGRSLMGLMTLGAAQGKEISIICNGKDADAACDALLDLVARGFDEDDNDGT